MTRVRILFAGQCPGSTRTAGWPPSFVWAHHDGLGAVAQKVGQTPPQTPANKVGVRPNKQCTTRALQHGISRNTHTHTHTHQHTYTHTGTVHKVFVINSGAVWVGVHIVVFVSTQVTHMPCPCSIGPITLRYRTEHSTHHQTPTRPRILTSTHLTKYLTCCGPSLLSLHQGNEETPTMRNAEGTSTTMWVGLPINRARLARYSTTPNRHTSWHRLWLRQGRYLIVVEPLQPRQATCVGLHVPTWHAARLPYPAVPHGNAHLRHHCTCATTVPASVKL